MTAAMSKGPQCPRKENIREGGFSPPLWVQKGRELGTQPNISIVPNVHGGNIIKGAYLTPTVSGAQTWVKWIHNPCHLGGPERQAQVNNQK